MLAIKENLSQNLEGLILILAKNWLESILEILPLMIKNQISRF